VVIHRVFAVGVAALACRSSDPAPAASAPATAPSPQQVFVEAILDEKPTTLRHGALIYPEEARLAGVEGTVVLKFIINQDGRVDSASVTVVSSPNKALSAAAVEAILSAVYTPGRVRGRPVRVLVQVPVNFSLRRVPRDTVPPR
jgi:periplasmic protein TonB